MKALLIVLGAFLMLSAGLLAGAVSGMVQDEIRTRLTRVPYGILRLAARLLPAAQREDLRAEWRSEASAIFEETKEVPFTGLLRATWYALGLLARGRAVVRELDGTAGERHRQLLDLLARIKRRAQALTSWLGGNGPRWQVISVNTPVGSVAITGRAALAASVALMAAAGGITASVLAGSGAPTIPGPGVPVATKWSQQSTDVFHRPDQFGFGGSTNTRGAAQFGWYGDADGTHPYDAISGDAGQLGFDGTAGTPNIAFAGKTAHSGGDSLAEFSISTAGSVGFEIPLDVCGDKSCDYAARLNTNASQIELGKRVNGMTILEAGAPFAASAATRYWMRANYDPRSGTLKMRIWPAGTAEPTSWNLSWTDTGTRLSSNYTGVGSWAASSTTATASVYCYAFSSSPAIPAQPCQA
jgi:hypothetical protein